MGGGMTEPQALMLFAAGLGTRMGELTRKRPKPLIPVAGRALIDHALDQVEGDPRIVVNLHYLGQMIRDHLAARPDIAFSDETETILETGGGLRAALQHLGPGPVFTLNSDAVWTGPPATRTLRDHWRPVKMDGLLLLVPRARATGYQGPGDFAMDAEGRLSRGTDFVYTGAQILRTEGLADVPQPVFSLNVLWDRMIAAGRLCGAVHPGGWCDVGRPSSIPLAEALFAGDHA